MNKQSISFKADEQKLTKTGGIEHYASNIVAYIEATFDLGTNWNGYDSVRAVWSNDYLTDISTVLDPDGKCIVPTEVLTDTGNVTVNLVGSIADGDTLTDRLTTYPCKAVIVDADAKVEGEETESITPSQFEQFVEIVHDEVEQVTGMTAEAETLPAGSDATASYNDGVLSLGIPRGDKGEQGETGETGDPAGFGNVTASVDDSVGTPSVVVTASGPNTAKDFDFAFHNLKGDKGDTGATGETGATGNGIASTVLNPDYTLTITFTDGTSYTTPSIRGAKGDTGDTGATGNGIQSTVLNADYTLTITFTDGTSYTTPSIRGEQGPAGPVSDVTVNGTSVVDQNGVAVITMPELVKTVNGNPIVLDDAFGEVKNLDVELTPIQDLNGYSKPWAAGAGKNLLNVTATSQTVNDTTFTVNSDGTIKISGTPSATARITLTSQSFGVGTWTCYGEGFVSGIRVFCAKTVSGTTSYPTIISSGSNTNIALGEGDSMSSLLLEANTSFSGTATTVKCEIAKDTMPTSWTPYSNICPITGHDSVTVTDTDGGSQSQSKTVTLPHTVYGADVDVTGGSGKETYAIIDLGSLDWEPIVNGYLVRNGITSAITNTADIGKGFVCSALASPYPDKTGTTAWNNLSNGEIAIYDTQVRAGDTTHATVEAFKTAMNGVQLCYQLATPTDLSTTPTSVELFSGDNVVSSDGDMELTYVQDMAIVIRKIESQL